jgi:tripartite-type tricarboxylate transporter receptor subunit TctC
MSKNAKAFGGGKQMRILSSMLDLCAVLCRCFVAGASLVIWAVPAASAQEAGGGFYKDKVIRVIVGFPTGGGFDLYARILADYLPKYIPSKPTVIVQNMPGAATALAAGYVYGVAPQDGTVLGLFHQGLLATQVLEVKQSNFDMSKFHWIGRMATRLNVGMAWHTSGVKTIEDAKKKKMVMGATTASATSAMVPRAINHAAGTQFAIVLGYQGSADMLLAMERGETEGMSTAAWVDLARDRPEWFKTGKAAIIFQISTKRHPDLPNVPVIAELASNDDDRKILELLASTEDMGRAFAAGPNVPADRVALLRAAFAQMMADPEFNKRAEELKLEIDYMHGDELQKLVANVGSFPPELGAKARKVLNP